MALTDGWPARAHYLRRIDAVAAAIPDATVIAIDIPIGLPETRRRDADVAAKRFLGPRQNSVFLAPVRAAIEAATHAEATAASMKLTGVGVSQQSYALGRRILEVDRWLPSAPCPVFEVHPEVSFAVLLDGPAAASKKTWAGMVERRRGLDAVGINLEDLDAEAAIAGSVDDMLDAAVAAWSARRLSEGTARPFPDPPTPEVSGRAIAIWA